MSAPNLSPRVKASRWVIRGGRLLGESVARLRRLTKYDELAGRTAERLPSRSSACDALFVRSRKAANVERRAPNAERQTPNGFVLWEMLLGLAIFCVGAIALTTALQQAVDTVILIHDESEVRQDLESILAEASVNKLQPGKTAIFMGDHRIQYEREVVSLPERNSKGQPVANLWQVTVRATWLARNRVRTSEAQEVLFQP